MQPSRLRPSRSRSRPFYATVLVLSLLTAYSFLAHSTPSTPSTAREPSHDGAAALFRRDAAQCSDLHSADDQCAFVRRHCMDADAGLLPYLEFYYCTLRHARPVAFVLLVAWLGWLFTTIGIAASDFFSVNLSTIASILGLSQSLAGVTFLAFGNGSPEVFSTFAAMSSNSPSMAVGELLGAASFITGVVAGSMALVREFRVDRTTYTRDICFFIVAVGFTMAFLADGQLRFWECWAMIGYYVAYVVTVVGCHWHGVRKQRRLRREGESRSHFYGVGSQSGDELAGEPYRDDPDDVDRALGQPTPLGSAVDADAFASLEGAPRSDLESQTPQITVEGLYGESNDDHDHMIAAEVTRNMRILRPGAKRHSNMNPIRPSLVGALEFRSALAQLQRESNLQLSSISGRSYSENHFGTRPRRETVADGLIAGDGHADATSTADSHSKRRDRALSSGDIPLPSAAVPEFLQEGHVGHDETLLTPGGPKNPQHAAALMPSPAARQALAPSPAISQSGGLGLGAADLGLGNTPAPKLRLQISSRRSSHSGASSPRSPFPRYMDSPMLMTPNAYHESAHFMPPSIASIRREESFPDLQLPALAWSPVRYWPYSVLPSPQMLLATLFPTLQGWREKSHWDRFLSTISVPSIFLLVITLPVADSELKEDATSTDGSIVDGLSRREAAPTIAVVTPEPDRDDDRQEFGTHTRGTSRPTADALTSVTTQHNTTMAAESTGYPTIETVLIPAKASSETASGSNVKHESPPWNRWLVCLQLFTGPLFAVFILWANLRQDWERPGRELLRMALYSLVMSLVLLVVILSTTTEHARPRFYYLLCFLGFVISIAWISTIAGEVVGVLKAFGVILGISEALLGLTIFAAGNSIGDLVADITVARLGYPVMALSACFGGPMLNILLGIGIGGVMMMVHQAKRKQAKHPELPVQYGPYSVQVGGTLLVSSITLLVSSITLLMMLLLLLVLVPMNKWILSRRIGWILIGLWAVSTVVSVVIEVTGVWGEVA